MARRRVRDRDDPVAERVGDVELTGGTERESGRADDEHVAVRLLAEPVGDHRLPGHRRRARLRDLQVEPEHGRLGHHVLARRADAEAGHADEERRGDAAIDHRHVAPGTVDAGIRDHVGDAALVIEHDETALALGRGGAVRARQAADDDPAALQHRHRGGEADPAGASGQVARNLREGRELPRRWRHLHDRGAEPLQVVAVVEIVDQARHPSGSCRPTPGRR